MDNYEKVTVRGMSYVLINMDIALDLNFFLVSYPAGVFKIK